MTLMSKFYTGKEVGVDRRTCRPVVKTLAFDRIDTQTAHHRSTSDTASHSDTIALNCVPMRLEDRVEFF
jgi:hypothetical protein